MQFLNSKQVEKCTVLQQVNNQVKSIPGLAYQDKLFFKIATFSQAQGQEAIRYGREQFLAQKGKFLILVVEEENSHTVWLQNDQLKLATVKKENKNISISQMKLAKLVAGMRGFQGLEIKDRRYNLKKYPQCFVGSEAVAWLTKNLNISSEEAIKIGQRLVREKWIHHVFDDHDFKDGNFFYRFYWDEDELIQKAEPAFAKFGYCLATGNWQDFLDLLTDDFYFWFPVEPFQGRNIGKEKAAQFFNYLSKEIFPAGLFLTIQRITTNQQTVVFEVELEGEIDGSNYYNQAAISFDLRDDKICAYRGYFGLVER